MAAEWYDVDFPNLRTRGFRRTSEPAYYNCVAFAVGDLKRKWWPGDYPCWAVDYWPPDAPNEETAAAFILALATVGFEPVNDGAHESDFEKIAIYARDGV